MQHLDEGTIHAWLDGALDPAQSAEIESHIGQCARCSAAVAEARGLVAGASRILNALDDVPANVVPKRAPIAPVRRQWRAAPWVTAIAAGLVLAIGLSQLGENSGQRALVSSESIPAAAPAVVADTLARGVVTAEAPPVSAATGATRTANAGAPLGRVAARDQATEGRDSTSARSEPKALSDVATRDARRKDAAEETQLRASAGAGAATQIAPAAPTQSVQDLASQRLQSAPAQQKMEQVTVTAAPERAAASFERAANAVADVRLAGCYRIEPLAKRMSVGAVQKAAGAVGRAAAPSAAAERSTASRFAAPVPPDIIRLDTTRHSLGFVVREARSDSSVGTWRTVVGDSARADLLAAGLFTFALKDRIACPEPR
jgi:hypothetical protein